jgi:hypothetical protein
MNSCFPSAIVSPSAYTMMICDSCSSGEWLDPLIAWQKTVVNEHCREVALRYSTAEARSAYCDKCLLFNCLA